MKFAEWLTTELTTRKMKPADLVRLSGLDSAVISNLVNGKRNAGSETATAIAAALDLPPAEVFRAAGILPPEQKKDDTLERIDHIYSLLSKDGKARALDMLEFLLHSDKKKLRDI